MDGPSDKDLHLHRNLMMSYNYDDKGKGGGNEEREEGEGEEGGEEGGGGRGGGGGGERLRKKNGGTRSSMILCSHSPRRIHLQFNFSSFTDRTITDDRDNTRESLAIVESSSRSSSCKPPDRFSSLRTCCASPRFDRGFHLECIIYRSDPDTRSTEQHLSAVPYTPLKKDYWILSLELDYSVCSRDVSVVVMSFEEVEWDKRRKRERGRNIASLSSSCGVLRAKPGEHSFAEEAKVANYREASREGGLMRSTMTGHIQSPFCSTLDVDTMPGDDSTSASKSTDRFLEENIFLDIFMRLEIKKEENPVMRLYKQVSALHIGKLFFKV
ncbi:hypothetical protein V1477_014319 [Vespula maculifrons]|uniref:Uncharacterized protein n=1 Tax=Vespula maculifrons TaxID=7453 RepID=A0ABD2BKQ1_VESMC